MIVLIKAILSHVTALVTQANGVNGLQGGFQYQDNQNGNGRAETNGASGHGSTVATNEELDAMRMQEILDKAVSGVLILILKWFKVSRKLLMLMVRWSSTDTDRRSEVRVHYSTSRRL